MRRALCIGIDEYSFGVLRGCVNDAERMSVVLQSHYDGAPNFDVKTLLAPAGTAADTVTRSKAKQAIEELFNDKAEVALLHFSGHGTQNNLGGFIVTQDAKAYDEGVAMSDILHLANNSRADEVVILLDCCHSGHLGTVPALSKEKSILRCGVSILTAGRGDQPSVEVGGGGVFTSLVVDALEGGAADILGNVTTTSVYAAVEAALGAWDQRPLFKADLEKLIPLRRCEPPIDITILRSLPTLFPVPAEDIPLCPECEQSHPNVDPTKNAIFRDMQALNRIHLVVPVGASHMYEAAVRSLSCRLTPAGRYFWRLARDGRI
jgi:hypothetical protein